LSTNGAKSTMTETRRPDRRRATAERNVKAILDAAEGLLRDGEQPSVSAVAARAGVSRPTVYAHFADRERLITALVERAVTRTIDALAAAELDRDPPVDALRRMLASSWRELDRGEGLARASAATLSPEAMRRAHESIRAAIGELIRRGRAEGTFRTDLPADWLAAACLALIHAAAEEVYEGGLDQRAALELLTASVVELFVGPVEP
jgi:TetR/AcrR family transcriptional regulator, mexCD-oprJ operon repressor